MQLHLIGEQTTGYTVCFLNNEFSIADRGLDSVLLADESGEETELVTGWKATSGTKTDTNCVLTGTLALRDLAATVSIRVIYTQINEQQFSGCSPRLARGAVSHGMAP